MKKRIIQKIRFAIKQNINALIFLTMLLDIDKNVLCYLFAHLRQLVASVMLFSDPATW